MDPLTRPRPILIRLAIALLGPLLLALLFLACGREENAARPEAPAPPPAPVAEAPAPPAPPKSEPASAETRATYQWYCAQCHGVKGKGNGINAKWLTVPPRDHTKAEYLETRTDQQLFDAIQQGGLAVGRAPCMPRWGDTLDEKTIHALVRYIRELCECEAI
jgi:mono/diheme cytochrome c family protein